MKLKNVISYATILLFINMAGVEAQESINTSNNNASTDDGSINYTVGQTIYVTLTSVDGTISEGIQQPYKISIVTEVEEHINISTKVYPNPTSDILTLQIETDKLRNYSYQLLSFDGQVLRNNKIADAQTQINMNDLTPATYFITILKGNTKINSFKIIKK